MARGRRYQQITRKKDQNIHQRSRKSDEANHQPANQSRLTPAPADLLVLQNQVGNQAVLRMMATGVRKPGIRGQTPAIQRNIFDDWKAKRAENKQDEAIKEGDSIREAARRGDATKLDTSGKERSGSDIEMDAVSGLGSAAGIAGDVSGIADSTLLTLSTTPKSYGTGENLVIAGSESMSGDVNAASAGVGIGTAGLAGFGNFIGLVDAIRIIGDKEKSKREKGMAYADIAQNAAMGTVSGGQVAGSAVGSAAGLAGAGALGDISTGAVELLGGIGDAITQAFATGKGLANLIIDVVQVFRGEKDWKKALTENGGALLGGLLPALKRFLGMSKSILSGVRWILKAVEVGGEFVQAFPVIGNSIGIFLKLLSIIEEGVKVVIEAIRISRAGWNIHKIGKVGAKALETAKEIIDINWKRVRRHLIPVLTNTGRIIGDFLGIAGNVLQIAGVATSAAYGAGVGLMVGGIATGATGSLLKVGMGATELGLKGLRWTKQAGRDLASKLESKDVAAGKEERGNFGKAMSTVFNTDKTTAAKQAKYKADANKILDNLSKLPKISGTKEEQADILATKYQPLMTLVKATGVSMKELRQQESLEKMQEKLVEAMKKR